MANNKNDSTPIEKLFGSKTRAKLLKLFFTDPNKSFYVREITRVIDEQINSVRRELMNLESIGVVKNETYDNKVYYSANAKHPFAHPLMELFSAKTKAAASVSATSSEAQNASWEDLVRPVRKYLDALLVLNRVPGEDGVDLLVIGNDKTKKLSHWAEVVEKKKGRPLNYVILAKDDYEYRRSVRDRFLTDILEMEVSETIDPGDLFKS